MTSEEYHENFVPPEFAKRLKRLSELGVLDDPNFKEDFLEAVRQAFEEQRSKLLPPDSEQK